MIFFLNLYFFRTATPEETSKKAKVSLSNSEDDYDPHDHRNVKNPTK